MLAHRQVGLDAATGQEKGTRRAAPKAHRLRCPMLGMAGITAHRPPCRMNLGRCRRGTIYLIQSTRASHIVSPGRPECPARSGSPVHSEFLQAAPHSMGPSLERVWPAMANRPPAPFQQ